MCNHYIPSTACPQALGSLRHFISPNLQFQHFKDLKPCWHWTACRAQPPAAPRKGVEKLPYSTYIPVQPIQILFLLQGTTASSAAWRNWDKCKLLRGKQCLWAPQRGTLARLSRTCCCGTTGSDSWQPGSWEQGPFTPTPPTAMLLPETKLLEKETPVINKMAFLFCISRLDTIQCPLDPVEAQKGTEVLQVWEYL